MYGWSNKIEIFIYNSSNIIDIHSGNMECAFRLSYNVIDIEQLQGKLAMYQIGLKPIGPSSSFYQYNVPEEFKEEILSWFGGLRLMDKVVGGN
jgi:hypothetical protein